MTDQERIRHLEAIVHLAALLIQPGHTLEAGPELVGHVTFRTKLMQAARNYKYTKMEAEDDARTTGT